MVDTVTNNMNFTILTVGGDSGTWGGIVNNTNTTPLDAILGATQAVTMTSADVTLTLAQWQNAAFKITGVLTGNHILNLPLSPNSVGNATAVGGKFVVDNETTGAFTVTVQTAATGSTGVVVPQGSRSHLYSDTVNVMFADDSRIAKLNSFAGNPNGSVAGTAASVNTPADFLWDRTNGVGYVCTTTGNAAAAVWTGITGQVPAPQGYLTPVSGTPIITGDSVGAATIYYTPYIGDLLPIWTGSAFGLFHFPELALALSGGSQASNGLYDVFGFIDTAGTKLPQVAFGPAWSAGAGGNQTAGSCARGTGAGGTALQRKNGLPTNAATIAAANNGASTFNIPANQGTYLGTIYVDNTVGQVTCHRAIGQNRKFGIWNAYNRAPIFLDVQDATANWAYGLATVRASNNAPSSWSSAAYNVGSGTTCNGVTLLCGLAEEVAYAKFIQGLAAAGASTDRIGIGVNSTTVISGGSPLGGVLSTFNNTLMAQHDVPPFLGIFTLQALEANAGGAANGVFQGGQAMHFRTQWRG